MYIYLRALARAKSEGVSSDPFGRTVRHGRSRERRSQRGRHHAKGTRYVGEIIAAMLGASASAAICGPVRYAGSFSCHLGLMRKVKGQTSKVM